MYKTNLVTNISNNTSMDSCNNTIKNREIIQISGEMGVNQKEQSKRSDTHIVQRITDKKKQNNEFVNKVLQLMSKSTVSHDELKTLFNNVREKWIIDNPTIDVVIKIGIQNFDLEPNNFSQDEIKIGYAKSLCEISVLSRFFTQEKMMETFDSDIDYKLLFNKIYEIIFFVNSTLRSLNQIKNVTRPSYEYTINSDLGLFRFTPIDYSKNNPFQNLLLYTLGCLSQHGYRQYHGFCYQPVYTIAGHYTFAWEQVMTIEQFIYSICKKEVNYEQWFNLTSARDNAKRAAEFLKECDDPQFPTIKKNRNVFSFKNGVYVSANKISDGTESYLEDRFYEYSDKVPIDNNIVACKYFDIDFDNYDNIDWYMIPTPNMQRIFDYQYQGNTDYTEICKWAYILIGRLFYEIHTYDDWQVAPFFKGAAGTGQSSIVTKIVQLFYEASDIGTLSNNCEKQFGLSGIFNSLIYIAPEIKENFGLDQASFQSMISGEATVVAVKGKDPVNINNWKIPGIMAGNVTPNWGDNYGSMSRRIILFAFLRKVKDLDKDPMLDRKLKKEIGAIIKKCNAAYLDAINRFGKQDIWVQLPQYFKDTQQSLKEETNPLQNFLMSSSLVYGDNLYCREATFKQWYQAHCKENGLPYKKYTRDTYMGPFEDCGITIERNKKLRYPKNDGKLITGTFLMGIDLAQENVDTTEYDNL